MKYCQDGLQIYFATEIQQLQQYASQFLSFYYGNYELQPNYVNGRPYFKMMEGENGGWGIWWDGINYWVISNNDYVGQTLGYAFLVKDIFCPNQMSEEVWMIWSGTSWYWSGNDIVITCECIFIQTNWSLNFLLKDNFS